METALQGIGALFLVLAVIWAVCFSAYCVFVAGPGAKKVTSQDRAFQAQIDSLREAIGVEARKRREIESDYRYHEKLIRRLYEALKRGRKEDEWIRLELRKMGAQMISLREDVGEYMVKMEEVEGRCEIAAIRETAIEDRLDGIGGRLASLHDHIEQVEDVNARSLRNQDNVILEWIGEIGRQGQAIHALKVGKANKVTPPPKKSPRAKKSGASA